MIDDDKDPDHLDELSGLLRQADAGQQVWTEDDQEVEINVKNPLNLIVSIKLTSDRFRALHDEAKQLGLGPQALARMWVLERLRRIEASRPATAPSSSRRSAKSAAPSPRSRRTNRKPVTSGRSRSA